MSLTEQIEELKNSTAEQTLASQSLAQEVAGKMGVIHSELNEKKAEVDKYLEKERFNFRSSNFTEDDDGAWDRLFTMSHRTPVEVTIYHTGGWYGPGSITFHLMMNNAGDMHVQVVSKLGSQYVKKIRATCDDTSNGPTGIEVFMPHRQGQRIPVSIRALAHELPTLLSADDEVQGINLEQMNNITAEVIL